jgi:transmembrane sensor
MIKMHAAERDRIEEEASQWVVRSSEPDFTPEDQRALEAWLDASPEHASAWISLTQLWDELPQMRPLSRYTQVQDNEEGPRPRGSIRLAIAAITATAVAFAMTFLFVSRPLAPVQQNYATEIAQMQKVTLPDGSVVTLGPKSALSVVSFEGKERRVQLTGGEAFFEVTHDKSRPFFVEAGDSLVRVLGTKFDVNRGSGSVSVAVLEGAVRVTDKPERGPEVSHTLRAGERAEIMIAAVLPSVASQGDAMENFGLGTPPVVTTVAQSPGQWRSGRLVYDNTRLADVVSDLNRYYAPQINLVGRDVGELRVSAAFSTSEISSFVAALGDVVPVSTQRADDGSYAIRAAKPSR